ncbi:hypothetical protein CRYUN_Cryun26dG0086400 [Craigia yunnanensis]
MLSVEQKQKYSRESDSVEGYGNDKIFSEQQTLDWNDRLLIIVSPEDKRKLKYWPENPEDFRVILNEYILKLQVITEVLLKALARSLNLKENCFYDQHGERANMHGRFNFYPPCSRPDLTLGLKPHADGSVITIVFQDKEVEGLQFMKDEQWIRVPILLMLF